MLNEELLKILCCPETHQTLRWADPGLLDGVNDRIGRRELVNRGGEPVREPLEAGLLRDDGRVLYPVREGIPLLLADEGIRLDDV